ncbi:MAG TPA: NADH:ubiquinone oxidoreductase subunit N, partial [Rhodoferax sp.]
MFDKLSLLAVFPEVILLIMACVILLFDLSVKSAKRGATYGLTLLTLFVVAALEAASATAGQTAYAFGNMVVNDAMGHWLKCFAAVAVMVTLVYGRDYAWGRDMLRGGDLFTLSLFSLLG